LASSIRDYVYGSTLPWSNNLDGAKRGSRLADARTMMDFLKELNHRVQEHNAAVVVLQSVWDKRIQEALANLGGLGDPSKYPTAAEIPNKFSVAVDVRPVPSMYDFKRVGIPAELADALGQRQAEQDAILAQNALDDLKKRILEELQRMSKQLGKASRGEKTRLYDSLVTNLQGLVSLARSMNMRNNPELTALADRIEGELLKYPVDVYREDTHRAASVAEAASKLAVDAAIEEIWK
jgi:molybdopterin converting factor small subunit